MDDHTEEPTRYEIEGKITELYFTEMGKEVLGKKRERILLVLFNLKFITSVSLLFD